MSAQTSESPFPESGDRALAYAAQRGDEKAREELIERFTPLIAKTARIYRGSQVVSRQELMQEGVVGLLCALGRFDPSRGTPFWAYASWWVRQAMQGLVSELAQPLVLSDRALRQLAAIRDAQRRYSQANGCQPSNAELALAAGIPRDQIERLLAATRRPRGLEEPVGSESDGATLRDLIADDKAQDAFDGVPRRLAAEQVPRLLENLDERQCKVIRARFGLDGRECTLRDLADELGVSAERVRQIEQASLTKLREVPLR
jgi:RNA polymerase primary sigma factor